MGGRCTLWHQRKSDFLLLLILVSYGYQLTVSDEEAQKTRSPTLASGARRMQQTNGRRQLGRGNATL